MRSIKACLDALASSGHADLHLLNDTAYGVSRGCAPERLSAVAAHDTQAVLAGLARRSAGGAPSDELGVLRTDRGERFRVTLSGQQALFRRLPAGVRSA